MKKKVMLSFAVCFWTLGLFCFCVFCYFYINPVEIVVNSVSYNDGALKIDVKNVGRNSYCAVISNEVNEAEIAGVKWNKFSDGVCSYALSGKGNYFVYVKNNNKIEKFDVNKTFEFSILRNKYYLALTDSDRIVVDGFNIGEGSLDFKSTDSAVVKVNDGVMTGVGEGHAKVIVADGFTEKEIDVVVTDLIDPIPKKYNYERPYLSCGLYSEKDAKLLDEILAFRVKEVGLGTRAGVVAAARFLTLEFPYRITYFSENGRLGNYSGGPKVDGEGRFYHKGLYLTSSKFDVLDYNYVDKGPAVWGCSMYSRPSKGMRSNGLDCSGFTTWVVYNGGFDIEDLAAHGGDSSIYNLNDIGKEVLLTDEIAMSGKIKAGDLLGEVTVSEGHSAIVVGVDKNNYYVAESLWISPLGVNINTYKKSELADYFETVNLMDDYYKKQGNYTAMW